MSKKLRLSEVVMIGVRPCSVGVVGVNGAGVGVGVGVGRVLLCNFSYL